MLIEQPLIIVPFSLCTTSSLAFFLYLNFSYFTHIVCTMLLASFRIFYSQFLFVFVLFLDFDRFSVNVLLSLCQQSEKRPLAGVVVIGNGQSAHAVAYAGSAMQLPVLWAKGGSTYLGELHPEVCATFILLTVFHAIWFMVQLNFQDI